MPTPFGDVGGEAGPARLCVWCPEVVGDLIIGNSTLPATSFGWMLFFHTLRTVTLRPCRE